MEKSKAFGFNLSETFENHLKHLITQFSTVNSLNNINSTEIEVTVELPEWASSLLSSLLSPPPAATPTNPEPERFPTTLIIAPITLAIVVGVGLLVYFKKRNALISQ